MPRRGAHPDPDSLLSPLEWKVYWIVCQRRSPQTAAEITTEMNRGSSSPLAESTVRTFLSRLVTKEFLATAPGERLAYTPSVPYDDALSFHVNRFLERFALGGLRDLDLIHQAIEQRARELQSDQ
jgi:predicted transcriptional regulator